MTIKVLIPLICVGVMLSASGCSMHRPHEKRMVHEAPVVGPEHFRIYDGEGRTATMADLVQAAGNADVVFIGEEHDDPAAHYLERELLERLTNAVRPDSQPEAGRPVILSMEMFERDVQTVVEEYLADLITERHFLKAARPWPAYRNDYRPMVEFAKAGGIPVIAANAPGRYVNRVARLGRASLAALPPESMVWLPPLPYGEPSPRYREKFENFMAAVRKTGTPHGPADEAEAPTAEARQAEIDAAARMMDAQSLWDAGMAWSLAEALEEHPGALAVHVNGKFHSASGLGIPEHLKRYRPDLFSLTVTILSLDAFPDFDPAAAGAGDFVIITDPSLKR